MVVSHSTLISPTSIAAVMMILDLPAVSRARGCEVGPRGLAALPQVGGERWGTVQLVRSNYLAAGSGPELGPPRNPLPAFPP